jgi:vacuolar-type H+-ATPase subunit I/STV1
MPDTEYNLADEMRRAADAIEEFNRRGRAHLRIYGTDTLWRPSELRREAEHVDAEDREAAEREAQAEELERDLMAARGAVRELASRAGREFAAIDAKYLIAQGWHK